MIADDVINEIRESASEWLEMTNNPDEVIIRILAHKVIALEDQIKYLEKRLEYASQGVNK